MQTNHYSGFLSHLPKQVYQILVKIEQERIITRIWQRDHTIWKNSPDEILNRLGRMSQQLVLTFCSLRSI